MDLSKLSDSDLEAIAGEKYDEVSAEGRSSLQSQGLALPTPKKKSTGEQVLDAAVTGVKGLDYAGGAIRGGLGRLAGLVSPEEYEKGRKGEEFFPSGAEMLKKAGVKGSLSDLLPGLFEGNKPLQDRWYVPNKGGMLDLDLATAPGFAIDTLTDPLTYLTGGTARASVAAGKSSAKAATAKKIAEAGAKGGALRGLAERVKASGKSAADFILHPSTKTSRTFGDWAYGSGLKPVMVAGEKSGKDVADVYYRHGINALKGSGPKLEATMDLLKTQRDEILEKATKAGASIDVAAAMKEGRDAVNEMVKTGRMTAEEGLAVLEDWAQRWAQFEKTTPDVMTSWKTDVRRGLPGKTWESLRASGGDLEQQVAKKVGQGFQTGVEKSVESTLGKQAADDLVRKNADLGTFLSTAAKAKEVGDKTKAPLDAMDFLILSGEFTPGGNNYVPQVFATKKIYDVLRSPQAKTRGGFFLKKAADNVPIGATSDVWARRKVVDVTQDIDEKKRSKK